MFFVVAVVKQRPASTEPAVPRASSSGLFNLIHGSFSSRKVARQYPVLAGIHRATDGALCGVLIAVLIMTALSLHSRHLWIVAYRQLETTRDLTQKLKSSTAMLEQHLLKRASLPLSMVRTNAEQLHYLDDPETISSSNTVHSDDNSILERFVSYPVNYGY